VPTHLPQKTGNHAFFTVCSGCEPCEATRSTRDIACDSAAQERFAAASQVVIHRSTIHQNRSPAGSSPAARKTEPACPQQTFAGDPLATRSCVQGTASVKTMSRRFFNRPYRFSPISQTCILSAC